MSLVVFGVATAACGESTGPRETDVAEVDVVDVVADTAAPDSADTFVDTAEDVDTQPDTAPFVCNTTAPTACPSPAPTYVANVAPIIEARCVSCHYGEIGGPWPLDTFGHVTDWRDTIRSAMLDCSMPPPAEQIPMTHEERMTILEWIRCGMPRGE